MGVDVAIEQSYCSRSSLNSNTDRQTRPPRALLPRKIYPRNIFHRIITENGNACVAALKHVDWLFEIKPPLSFLRRHTTRIMRRNMNPGHVQLFSKFTRNVMFA